MGKWIARPAGRVAAVLAGWMLLAAAPALAVTPGQVSWTAEGVAALRAIAAQDPDPKIRCPDHLAEKFVTADFWRYSPYAPDYDTSMKVVRAYRVGTYYFLNARTHFIDEILTRMAEDGLTQAVSLGAGLDTRAYRFSERYPKIRFFEMDLPATIEFKKKKVAEILGRLPASTTYVAIDFNRETIADALTRSGWDPSRKTYFIWEGCTYYISKAAVDDTLAFFAAEAAPGSAAVFDYVPDVIIAGDYSKYPAARFTQVRCEVAGEPWTFGFPDGAADRYVQARGLAVVEDIGAQELKQRYLIRSNGTPDGEPAPYYRIMHLTVPQR
jgi:methyltransferase (TIGR00027 family)